MSNLKNNYIDWRKKTGQNVFSLIPIRKKGTGLKWFKVIWLDQLAENRVDQPWKIA